MTEFCGIRIFKPVVVFLGRFTHEIPFFAATRQWHSLFEGHRRERLVFTEKFDFDIYIRPPRKMVSLGTTDNGVNT